VSIFSKEPVVIIGLVASIVVIVAQQLLTSGIVTSAGVVQWLNLIIAIVPTIAALLSRSQVTPTASLPVIPAIPSPATPAA
jgi:hypothetical protein